jgi:putative NADH-flavin reductase
MRLTILGATGGTGRELIRQGLAAGHEITAVVRDPARLGITDERLVPVRADVFDAAALEPAVKDADAVLSVLGHKSVGDTTPLCAEAARATIAAMRATERRRLLVVSAAPVARGDNGDRPLYAATIRPILRRVLRRGYADMAVMEERVRASDLDWTIFRPPRLTNAAPTGRVRTALNQNVPGGYLLSRADLAAEMLLRIDDTRSCGAAVGIGN